MFQACGDEISFARIAGRRLAVGREGARARNDDCPLGGVRVFGEDNFLLRADEMRRFATVISEK